MSKNLDVLVLTLESKTYIKTHMTDSFGLSAALITNVFIFICGRDKSCISDSHTLAQDYSNNGPQGQIPKMTSGLY